MGVKRRTSELPNSTLPLIVPPTLVSCSDVSYPSNESLTFSDPSMAFFPLTPPHLPFPINTTATPIFVPTPAHVLAIESYFGLGGPGLNAAFLYNPLNPNSGVAIAERGRLAPVLEARWREFENAIVGAQAAMRDPRWGGGEWSRPQNWTCPTSVYYDLGPGPGALERFGLSGHMVDVRYGQPDDVQWYTPAGKIITVDIVPEPFLEVEHIIRNLTAELLPEPDWRQLWLDWGTQRNCTVRVDFSNRSFEFKHLLHHLLILHFTTPTGRTPYEMRPTLREIARMAKIGPKWGQGW
ncbi:hypothetical protein C8R43DRAFT_941076 [Mycena crocata]|nr:hypothetical protein C8R43DRAFT_941076 [Mycena crocata]